MKRRTRDPRPALPDDAVIQPPAQDPAPSGMFGPQMSGPPADLVTSERLKGVRFDLAQPRGYYTEQVDTLVRLLTSSLAWHEEALYQRDQGIHVLQADLDTATQQEATLRAQVEVFRVQGSVTVGEDGHILRKSQVAAANDALAEAKGATAALDQKLAASIEEVRSLREWADVVIPQTTQIAELARVAQEQLDVTSQELASAREQSAALTAQVDSLEAHVASLEAQVASLEAQQLQPSTEAVVTAPAVDTADTDWPAETAGDLQTDWPAETASDLHTDWPAETVTLGTADSDWPATNMDTDWPVESVSTAEIVDAGWSVPNDDAVDAVDPIASAFAARPRLPRRV